MHQISITKITDINAAHKAIRSTIGKEGLLKATLFDIYSWEHSITRTQVFWVEMKDVPTFVSVHLVRHKIGVEHFVYSNRIDRGGKGNENRYTPVTHSMLINAEALIKIARARLCFKASKETRQIVFGIREKMKTIDEALYHHMLPNCFHQGLICKEPKPCGQYPVTKWKNAILLLPKVKV